jgi:Protein of unknown function (DUF3617)
LFEEPDMDRMTTAIRLGALLLMSASACGVVLGDEFPPRKAGLWQIDMAMPGGQLPRSIWKMSTDAATDAEIYWLGMSASQGMCNAPDIHRSGSTVTVGLVCTMGPSKATTQEVTRFTGDTAYHIDANTKFDPPMSGRDALAMTQDAKWAGPCPADVVPGDMLMGKAMG